MPRVLIQAGHHPGRGGAPGEAAWTFSLAGRIAQRLRAAGVEAVVVGNWLNQEPPPETGTDWDLFLALHYDAAIYADRGEPNSGCFADRSSLDPMGVESDRFIALWEGLYPARAKIPLTNGRRNANTSRYYAFRDTTANTPGVIIEHGCGAPVGTGRFPPGDDSTFLHDKIDTVADLDAQAVLSFLGVHQLTLAAVAERTGARTLVEQVREWQAARRRNGQDSNDWDAAREHLLALGFPDPGELPPIDFPQVTLAEVGARTNTQALVEQVREWQAARRRNGENPHDWIACRAHLLALGVPDPGDRTPLDFATAGEEPSIRRYTITVPPDDVANVRQGPGPEFRVVATLPAGVVVECDREQIGQPVGGDPVWCHLRDGAGWIHRSLLRPVDAIDEVVVGSSLLASPRAAVGQVLRYVRSKPNGAYTEDEVGEIVGLYFETAMPVGIDPLLAAAQMVHETDFLSSHWSQPPRHNPAGIGVTGEPGAGISFPDWRAAVRAHVGRLLAYALPLGQETATQASLIAEALVWRPLPNSKRGVASIVAGLTGTWATDPEYASKLCAHAAKIQRLQPRSRRARAQRRGTGAASRRRRGRPSPTDGR